MKSLKKGQWILIAAIAVLVVVIFSLDLVAPNTSKANQGGAARDQGTTQTVTVTLESEAKQAKQNVTATVKQNIESLEKGLKGLEAVEKAAGLKQIAESYAASSQFAAAGFYYSEAAAIENTSNTYVLAGDYFRNEYRTTGDSLRSDAFAEKATTAYKQALEINPSDLEAKTGLGACYVDASQNPMEGIQLLLSVVKENPEHINANLNLGLFSMRSGQYDKAIERFETVAKYRPTAEIYAFIAESYEKVGDNTKAIQALEKVKEYVIDPSVINGIDEYIKTLKK